jgi:adhesin transport system membrane fusion protein
MFGLFKRKQALQLGSGDVPYVSPVAAAQVVEPAPAALWAVYLMLVALVAAMSWAFVAKVDIVAKSSGRVLADGREQLIASLEGGILRELLVR